MEIREQKSFSRFSVDVLAKSTKKSYNSSDFLDPQELHNEYAELEDKAKLLLPAIVKQIDKIPEGKIDEWNQASVGCEQLRKVGENLNTRLNQFDQGNNYVIVTDLKFLLQTARTLILTEQSEKRKRLAGKYGFAKDYEHFAQITQLTLTGDAYIKIGGISLRDIFQNTNASPAFFYKRLVESDIIKRRFTHEKVLKENMADMPLASLYPNVTKETIQDAAGETLALLNFTLPLVNKLIDIIFPNPKEEEKELLSRTKEIIHTTHKIKQKIYNSIFKLNSPFFADLKDTALNYLTDGDNETNIVALRCLGIDCRIPIVSAYRKAKDLSNSTSGENSQFYRFLSNSILDYLEELPNEIGILTIDNLVEIVDENNSTAKKEASGFDELRQIAHSIFQKSETNYFVSEGRLDGIDWDALVQPQSIELEFLNEGYKTFTLRLHYQNEDGEILDIPLDFDLGQQSFDWPFIESPNDPKMSKFKNVLFNAVKGVLDSVKRHAEDEFSKKQKQLALKKQSAVKGSKISEDKQVINQTEKPSASTTEQEIHAPRKKFEKPKIQRPSTPFQEALEGIIPVAVENRVKKHISFPEDPKEKEKLRDQIKRFSREIQNKIGCGINDFNKKGGSVKGFKALTGKPAPDGRKRYEYKIGDYRILLVKKHSQNGNGDKIWDFEIYKIGNRKEIFKDRQDV